MTVSTETIELNDNITPYVFAAGTTSCLSLIKTLPNLSVFGRGNCLTLKGNAEKIALVKRFLNLINKRINQSGYIDNADVRRIFAQFSEVERGEKAAPPESYGEIIKTCSGRPIRPLSAGQKLFIDTIEKNTITVVNGPAGTGKTYLAAAMAIKALKEKRIAKIILSRPVVEAGESLGYLPGDLKEKVDPHFRPLYDCLQEFIGMARFEQLVHQGIIEITPLAYMRGRTFNEAFIILDEAQNTTMPQMKMVLTRLGCSAKLIITGDQTQIDLPRPEDSSLYLLQKIIGSIDSVAFISLKGRDVIRHEVVKKIVEAFDTYKKQERKISERQ